MEPVRFAAAADGGEETRTIGGHIGYGAPDWVYLPIEVPDRVNRISVSYRYDRPTPPAGQAGNALDIGVFDQRGHGLGPAAGFRGWSGGSRENFTISASEATPGYLPGPIDAGTWYLILGPYTVHPQGLDWAATITLGFGPDGPPFRPQPAPLRATGRGAAWYRGDVHLHTVHSDGRRLPAEAAADARPDLLIIDGEEITTRNGHYTALGLPAGTWIDWRYRAADGALARFVRDIHRAGGLAVAAHPLEPCVGCGWKFGYTALDPGARTSGRREETAMDAVEVWNGPWSADDEAVVAGWDNLLVAGARTGTWLPAVGGSDAHREPEVIGLPHNVVHATDLTRDAILDGVRSGQVWLAESAAVNLTFTAASGDRRADIGHRLAVADEAAVRVTLAVTGTAGATVRFITDQGVRVTATVPATGSGTVTWTTTPRNSAYVRAEVRRPDTMVALTNPIFLGHLLPGQRRRTDRR
jgi:hypothetical protein